MGFHGPKLKVSNFKHLKIHLIFFLYMQKNVGKAKVGGKINKYTQTIQTFLIAKYIK
jgi:hypothetical protein